MQKQLKHPNAEDGARPARKPKYRLWYLAGGTCAIQNATYNGCMSQALLLRQTP